MHYAGLDHGLGKYRGYRVGKALKPVDHCCQDVLDATVAQFAHYPQPERGALGLLDSESQDLRVARTPNSNRKVYCAVADQAFVADFHPDRVEEYDRIG